MNKFTVYGIALVLFGVSTFFSYSFFKSAHISGLGNISYKAPTDNVVVNPSENPNEPKTEACPLNGELLTKTQKALWEKRRPLAVMIENSLDARPQSGATSADIIYEALAEGGITRTMQIFYCKDAPYIGPVRSARVPFLSQATEYGDPLYAHVGGANCDDTTGSGCANGAKADALGMISKLGWDGKNDLSEFSIPFPVFYRDPDRLPGRATEHTVYSSTQKLWTYAKDKRNITNVDADGVSWDKDFQPWKFKDDSQTKGSVGVAKKIHVYFEPNTPDYYVDWQYDPKTNTYLRFNGGQPHIDKNNGKQWAPKNVVVAYETVAPADDNYPGGHVVYGVTGTGNAVVFQDGNAIQTTWKKKDISSRMRFYDEKGTEIEFNRGQVFIQLVPIESKVTY